jgi:hypothetical protein
MRIRGSDTAQPIIIREVSSTEIIASVSNAPFTGAAIEIELRGIGLVTAGVLWTENGRFCARFDRIIDPGVLQIKIGGSYSSQATPSSPNLRRV